MVSLDDIGMSGKTQVVIAAETGDMLTVEDDLGALRGMQDMPVSQQAGFVAGLSLLAQFLPE